MSLTDIMSAMNLASWATAAMVLFLAAFVAIVARTFSARRRTTYEAIGRLPLDETTPGGLNDDRGA